MYPRFLVGFRYRVSYIDGSCVQIEYIKNSHYEFDTFAGKYYIFDYFCTVSEYRKLKLKEIGGMDL